MAHEDPQFDRAIDALAQVFIDDAEQHHRSELEPFDLYAQKIRNEFHSTLSDFRKRFAHGYQVLQKKVQDQKLSGEMKKPGGAGPWIRA